MVTVKTKDELKDAINNKEKQIEIIGSLASELEKKSKLKKGLGIGSVALIIGGIAVAPFTGGASIIPAVAAGTAMSTGAIVAILVAIAALTGLSFYALKRDYTVEIEHEDSVSGKTRIVLNRKK